MYLTITRELSEPLREGSTLYDLSVALWESGDMLPHYLMAKPRWKVLRRSKIL